MPAPHPNAPGDVAPLRNSAEPGDRESLAPVRLTLHGGDSLQLVAGR